MRAWCFFPLFTLLECQWNAFWHLQLSSRASLVWVPALRVAHKETVCSKAIRGDHITERADELRSFGVKKLLNRSHQHISLEQRLECWTIGVRSISIFMALSRTWVNTLEFFCYSLCLLNGRSLRTWEVHLFWQHWLYHRTSVRD